MRLLVVSHKQCRRLPDGEGFVTDGGFPLQMAALSELFDETVLCLPVDDRPPHESDRRLRGRGLRVTPLPAPSGSGLARKARLPVWLAHNLPLLLREMRDADAVHAPVPGDIGTIGIALAHVLRKPLFVRHCGNWSRPRTRAERAVRRYMERAAGGPRVMFATGGDTQPPSAANRAVRWIFSTSLSNDELTRIGRVRSFPADGPARLVIVCRQHAAKGTDVAIRALAQLVAGHHDVAFDVVGDGPDLAAFETLASALDVRDRVTFHGRLSHEGVLAVLDRAHVLVFPTRFEGFPKAVVEALATGLPVVATPVSVIPTLLADGGGVLVEERTPDAVAEAVAGVLADPDRYKSMSGRAIQAAAALSLERWQDQVGTALEAAWGPLRSDEARTGTAGPGGPRIGMVGPMLGGNEGWVVSQGEILARHFTEDGRETHLTSQHPRRLLRLVDTVACMLRWRRRVDVWVVMVFSGLGFLVAEVATGLARLQRRPVVLNLRGGNLPDFATRHPRRVARLLRAASVVVAPSPFLAHRLADGGTPIRVIPNVLGVPDAPFTRRARLGPALLWMRTFHPLYEPELAVRALHELRKHVPEATLTMAGQEKGALEGVRALAEELGEAGHVRFPGFFDAEAKRREFPAHDIFLNTNRVDNAPVSVLEAAAFGLPIVATAVGGIPYLFEDGETALLVPPGDVDAMVAAVRRLLDDEQLAACLSQNGRELAERCRWDAVRAAWDEVFADAGAGR